MTTADEDSSNAESDTTEADASGAAGSEASESESSAGAPDDDAIERFIGGEDPIEGQFEVSESSASGPTVSIPEVEIPSVGSDEFSDSHAGTDLEANIQDVDSELLNTFVICVVLANVALLAVSLGVMLIFFRGMWGLGTGLVVVGLLAGIRTYMHYYRWERGRDRSNDEADIGAADPQARDDPGDHHAEADEDDHQAEADEDDRQVEDT